MIAANDFDGDTVPDSRDNCIFIKNLDQKDSNADSFGNACDADNDGRPNHCDNCPFVSNHDQRDADADGAGDSCQKITVASPAREQAPTEKITSPASAIFEKPVLVPIETGPKPTESLATNNPQPTQPQPQPVVIQPVLKETLVKNDYSEFDDTARVGDELF